MFLEKILPAEGYSAASSWLSVDFSHGKKISLSRWKFRSNWNSEFLPNVIQMDASLP
jgi:hypothetical protein